MERVELGPEAVEGLHRREEMDQSLRPVLAVRAEREEVAGEADRTRVREPGVVVARVEAVVPTEVRVVVVYSLEFAACLDRDYCRHG